ncbi:MAG: glycosyltransferase, partial [Rothia dentocariosa]
MRRGLSRRNLVAGTAWAAPLVLSTAVIPAYASSSADDGPCLDPDKSYGIFAKDVRTAAQSRAAGEKGYEEIVVPDYASYMRFDLHGGAGGDLTAQYSEVTGYNRTGGAGGGGAHIQGTVKVTPGQRIKFYVGAGGVGYYDRPAKGGEGYGNGGSSAALPTELGSDVQGKLNSHSNKVTVYSGSGGGSSAIVMVDAKTSQETVLAVAGGGGGAGARGFTRANQNGGTWITDDPTSYESSNLHIGRGGSAGDDYVPEGLGRSGQERYHQHYDAEVAEAFILTTAGGGSDGINLLRAAAQVRVPDGYRHVVVTGPQLDAALFHQVAQAAGPRTVVRRSWPGMSRHIQQAAAVIAMAGYNTVTEILASETPALLVPRETPRLEQFIRA